MENKNTIKFDFAGYATKNDIVCADGAIIKQDAFAHQNGTKVPLVFQHDHKDLRNVVGHAELENRPDGVYAYCSLNDTENGKVAKELVSHGDIVALSIYANKLKRSGASVTHGEIKEVSLVLAGANPGAFIDTVMVHSDNDEGETATIYHEEVTDKSVDENGIETELRHEGVFEFAHADDSEDNKEETIEDIIQSMNEKQQNVFYYCLGHALEQGKLAEEGKEDKKEDPKEEAQHAEDLDQNQNDNTNKGENNNMNAFETNANGNVVAELTHDEMSAIFNNLKAYGSLSESVKHFMADHEDRGDALQHSITTIANWKPEAHSVNAEPYTIARNMDWVSVVMNNVKKSPFNKIRSNAANITADAARAKGYTTGNQKTEEVVVALNRVTEPQTIYKLQKLNRDDVIDITDFSVVNWVRNEMDVMLDEEAARAILIGDGRSGESPDKIDPLHIRPIYGDNATYTVVNAVVPVQGKENAALFIDEVIKTRKFYKGSGNLVAFMPEDQLSDLLLLKDLNGHFLYNLDTLKTVLRCKAIVACPVMENTTRTEGDYKYTLQAIFVDLADYCVGANARSGKNFFEDFDLNYNKQEYLLERRMSGALVKPYSALVYELKESA